MKRMIVVMLVGFALVMAAPVGSLLGSSSEAWAAGPGEKMIKMFKAPFLSLPLRGFFYPPAVETDNFATVKVFESGQGVRHSELRYTFRGLTANTVHTLWFVNLFMITRHSAFPGVAPPSPQGNPYLPWTSGTGGVGYDADGDGVLTCGEGVRGFDPVVTTEEPTPGAMNGVAFGTGQSPTFDQNSFCTNEWGHANPVIRLPYDITTKNVPAQTPPLFQTEVVEFPNGETLKHRHVIDISYKRLYDENPDSPRFGYQKVDNLGRPIFQTYRLIPMVVCTHYDGGLGMTHGHHPGNGPGTGPTPTAFGTDHECLMAAMQTTQARDRQED
tara:strand:- start:2135 stop:3118 length:984 start_codon:yes stop_codon:yes gene_type:complete